MTSIKFSVLWDNYSTGEPCRDRKTGKIPDGFSNQCAIRLGLALAMSGVSFASFRGKRCPCAPHESGMAASASELAEWLGPKTVPGCSEAEPYTGRTVFEGVRDRTGIIFLGGYWHRPNDRESARSGNHIDLWNGVRMSNYPSWFRVHFGISWDGVFSDYRLASTATFWEIK